MSDTKPPSNHSPESEDIVLLVDDNTTNLQLLHETLDGIGYRLLIAKNGKTALAIADKANPSLILLDIMMPEMDGYEVCRRLKSAEKTRQIRYSIVNENGQTVFTTKEKYDTQQIGEMPFFWDGKNRAGDIVSSGIYFIYIDAGQNIEPGKIAVIN